MGRGNLWGCCGASLVASQLGLMTFAGSGAAQSGWAVAAGGDDLWVATELRWGTRWSRECMAGQLLDGKASPAGQEHLHSWPDLGFLSAGTRAQTRLFAGKTSHWLQGSLCCHLCLGLLAISSLLWACQMLPLQLPPSPLTNPLEVLLVNLSACVTCRPALCSARIPLPA